MYTLMEKGLLILAKLVPTAGLYFHWDTSRRHDDCHMIASGYNFCVLRTNNGCSDRANQGKFPNQLVLRYFTARFNACTYLMVPCD
jgi:hypothetical protein